MEGGKQNKGWRGGGNNMVTTTELCEYMKAEIKEAEIKTHQTESQIKQKQEVKG